MNDIRISIIVPIYNVEQYLSRCLDSLVNQTMREIEIICVNDGSSDDSLKILYDYAIKDNRIIILDQDNKGVSIARNKALKRVRGEYYMFVDSDDWLDPETCEETYMKITQYKADCLMFSYVKEFTEHSVINHIFEKEFINWNKGEIENNLFRRFFGPLGEELSRPQDMDIVVTPCMQLYNTSKFVHLQFDDIREVGTFEDGLYQMKIYKECKKFIYIDKPYYHYLKTNCSSVTSQYKGDLYIKWLKLFERIEDNIKVWDLPNDYKVALNNRIAISVLGLGLNQVHSEDSFLQGSKQLKHILSLPRYKEAISQLEISAMPLPWKSFFFLAKHQSSLLLFALLKVIEYLRTHK